MRATPLPSEEGRKLVHMAAGGGALLLRYLTWWEAAILLGLALVFNLYILPRVAGGRLLRAHEVRRSFQSGVVLYPLTLLFLLFALPDRPDIVAAAWGILAIGDGMATLAGRIVPGPRLPWNPEKSVSGTVALFAFGATAGSFLCWWCRPALVPPPYLWFSLGAPVAAAASAALVETLPVRLNDNVTVPVTATAVLWWMSLLSEEMLLVAGAAAAAALPLAVAVNGAAAVMGRLAGAVTTGGAATGAAIGTIVLLTIGGAGWVLLFLTLAFAAAASRLGWQRKQLLGIAEERGGRRATGSALANTLVATAAAVLAVGSYLQETALVAFVAALAAAGSDTVASEAGKAWGRRTWIVGSFREVRPGTPGAISLEGTLAGLLAALVLGAVAAGLGLVDREMILPIVAGATAGAFGESLLAAMLEHRRILNNDLLNVLNTAIAVAVAVSLAG